MTLEIYCALWLIQRPAPSYSITILSIRLTSTTSPQGAVTYTYDKIGRRKTMAVAGQPTVNYAYDSADRLTAVSQGSINVGFTYDQADRLITKTYPTGIVAEYDYDAASQVTSVTYKLGENILGDLTYEYDNTTASGAASSNQSQFTGRENDGTGLYYYRARYYAPVIQRFIGEDPIGLAGGDSNFYAYVGNSPTNLTDPFGFQGGGPHDLGLGYSARVDTFSSGEGFEIHVFNAKGEEIGICSGRLGWIAKHGHPAAVPPGTPRDVLNKLNGLNMTELRARNLIPAKGTVAARESKSGGYLSQGRTLFTVLNVLSLGLSIFNEYQAETELEMRARKSGLTPEQQFFRDSERISHPEFYMTPLGPMPNPYRHGRPSPFMYETRKNRLERDDAPKDKNNPISTRDSLGTGR